MTFWKAVCSWPLQTAVIDRLPLVLVGTVLNDAAALGLGVVAALLLLPQPATTATRAASRTARRSNPLR